MTDTTEKYGLTPIEPTLVGVGHYPAGDTHRIVRFVEAIVSPLGCAVTVAEHAESIKPLPISHPPSTPMHLFMPGATLDDVRKAFFED